MIIQDRIATDLFQAGRNCWRIEESRHVSFLIDGDPEGTREHETVRLAEGGTVEVLPPFAGG